MQISLALSVMRCRDGDPELASRILCGHLEEAARMGLQRLWRPGPEGGPVGRSLLGQMVGRTLLALGREQEAQELLQEMRKTYDQVSRHWLRWCASLDQGWSFLYMNRPGRAIECFRAVVDDQDAPAELAAEAMNCLADALHSLGECQRAITTVEAAGARCADAGLAALADLSHCHLLELTAMQMFRQAPELSDHALATNFRDRMDASLAPSALRRQLAEQESAQSGRDLVVHRLQLMQMLLTCTSGSGSSTRFTECLAWLKDRRLAGLEPNARIESAMALLAGGAAHAASEVLGALAQNDTQVRQNRYSMDLQYCRSKLLQVQGQMMDSMSAYKQHVEQAVYVLKRDYTQVAKVQESQPASEGGDASRLRLPLKYRGAYQFIVDHLSDNGLSVKHVAAHAGVTERSLQLAFRAHLGLTPAEFIRKRRMECIRDELQSTGSIGAKVSVLDVASRWGVSNRSTLAQNYRQLYAETPFETLHGRTRESGSK